MAIADGSLSFKEKALHYVSLFWKLVFALIPPTDYMNGWLTFFVAIFAIGVLTAIIGDVAALFGCTIGLKDTVGEFIHFLRIPHLGNCNHAGRNGNIIAR